MITKTTPNDTLKNHDTSIKKIVNDLRKIIMDAVPVVTEKVLPGWHAIGFRYTDKHFCAIFPFEKMVKLYFEYGSKLTDTDHILEGNTKQTRFISFLSPTDVSKQKIQKLVREAVLQLSHKK